MLNKEVTTMSEFMKELRYHVFKIKDLQAYLAEHPEQKSYIECALAVLSDACEQSRLKNNKRDFNCVVVESDWRCYDETWKLVETEHEENQL